MSKSIGGIFGNKIFRRSLICVVALLCILAVTLVLLPRGNSNNLSGENEPDLPPQYINSDSLVNANGWNNDLISRLSTAINKFGNGVALGSAARVAEPIIVRLGNIDWQVVYKQNGVVTLYANEPVTTLEFGSSVGYTSSAVRDYLNNEFYNELIEQIGYEGFEDLIVSSGDLMITTQLEGMQSVPLFTVNGEKIKNNDIVAGDKIWLPSALEVGGFSAVESAPAPRVNSYNHINTPYGEIVTGLWNVSDSYRATESGAWLRSNTDGKGLYIDKNGIIRTSTVNSALGVRPALNLVLPEMDTSGIVAVSNPLIQSAALLAAPDYSNHWTGSGTSASPYIISTADQLVVLSDSVMAGQDWAGKYFRLDANINLGGITVWAPIGRSSVFPFKGNFDGNGHIISDLAESGSGLVGLFGYINNATITQVGVSNSTWNTTNEKVGAIVCEASGASVISKCFSQGGIAGTNYIGGIVGYVSNTSVVRDCYNVFGVNGTQNVGGIAGYITGSASIVHCYNIGSTLGSSNVGGIVGGSSSTATPAIDNCFYSNSTNNGYGTYKVSYADMQGKSTTLYSGAGWDMYDASTGAGTWFISWVVNDSFPILQVFLKSVSVELTTNLPAGGTYYVTSAGSGNATSGTFAKGTQVTLTATANSGYRFVGWYHFAKNIQGDNVFSNELFKNDATYAFNIDDYYYLEARFVKTYTVNIEGLYQGFSSAYPGSGITPMEVNFDSNTGYRTGVNVYDENTVITIRIYKNINQLKFTEWKYNRTGTAQYTSTVPQSFWQGSVISGDTYDEYKLIVNNSDGKFSSGTILYLQAQFIRQFSVTVAVSPTDSYVPTASILLGTNGATLSTTGTTTGVVSYNVTGGLTLTYDLGSFANIRKFTHWKIECGEVFRTINSDSTSKTIALSDYTFGDADYNMTITAVFGFKTYTITAEKALGVTKQTNDTNATSAYGKIFIVSGTTPPTSISTENASLTVEFGSSVTIAVLPAYGLGYKINGVTQASTAQTVQTGSNGIYYVTVTMGPQNTAYTVKFEYIPVTINLTANLDGNPVVFPHNVFTLSGGGSNFTYYSDISGITLSVADSEYQKYFLSTVNTQISGGSMVKMRDFGTGEGGYVGAKTYNLFESGNTVANIYTNNSTAMSLTNGTITVRADIIGVSRNVNVVMYYKGTTTLVNTPDVHYLINDKVPTGSELYILNTNIKITGVSESIGYRVSGFKLNDPALEDVTPDTPIPEGYQNQASYTFELKGNTTVYIYFEIRTYEVTVSSNMNDLTGVTESLSTIGITATNNGQSVGDLGGSSSNPNPFASQYGNTVVVTFPLERSSNGMKIAFFNVKVYNNTVPAAPTWISTHSTEGNTFSITFNTEIDKIKIEIEYRVLVSLNIKIDESDSTSVQSQVGSLLVLENKATGERSAVILMGDASGVNVDCAVGDYQVSMILAIFETGKIEHTNPGGTSTDHTGGTSYVITIQEGGVNYLKAHGFETNLTSGTISGYVAM